MCVAAMCLFQGRGEGEGGMRLAESLLSAGQQQGERRALWEICAGAGCGPGLVNSSSVREVKGFTPIW